MIWSLKLWLQNSFCQPFGTLDLCFHEFGLQTNIFGASSWCFNPLGWNIFMEIVKLLNPSRRGLLQPEIASGSRWVKLFTGVWRKAQRLQKKLELRRQRCPHEPSPFYLWEGICDCSQEGTVRVPSLLVEWMEAGPPFFSTKQLFALKISRVFQLARAHLSFFANFSGSFGTEHWAPVFRLPSLGNKRRAGGGARGPPWKHPHFAKFSPKNLDNLWHLEIGEILIIWVHLDLFNLSPIFVVRIQ